jgi:hypothetical protein
MDMDDFGNFQNSKKMIIQTEENGFANKTLTSDERIAIEERNKCLEKYLLEALNENDSVSIYYN